MTNVTHRIRAAHPRRPLLPLTLCAAVMMVMPQLVQAQWSYLDCGSTVRAQSQCVQTTSRVWPVEAFQHRVNLVSALGRWH